MARGLRPDDHGKYHLPEDAQEAASAAEGPVATFLKRLPTVKDGWSGSFVRKAATDTAEAMLPELREAQRAAGFLRSAQTRWRIRLVPLTMLGVLMLGGVLRIQARAALYGDDAPVPIFLLLLMVTIAVVWLRRLSRVSEATVQQGRYLDWLRQTRGLRFDDYLHHYEAAAFPTTRFLFEPFFSTRSRGTGLGLYICRELCERYGASIEYRPGGGAQSPRNDFIVTLRRAAVGEAEATLPLHG